MIKDFIIITPEPTVFTNSLRLNNKDVETMKSIFARAWLQ
ncbi:hypothetical protein J559_2621 [Acinetobacter sp. 983759]|nr:hypothetical protein J559_2621 [Acinetobacter sp. 983759]